jgi:hypothetical protein
VRRSLPPVPRTLHTDVQATIYYTHGHGSYWARTDTYRHTLTHNKARVPPKDRHQGGYDGVGCGQSRILKEISRTKVQWSKGQILLQIEAIFLLSRCRQQTGLNPNEIAVDGLRVSSDREMGWHADASHLYYSAGWWFESEQAATLSLHKSRCMLEEASHVCLLRMRAGTSNDTELEKL